MYRIVYSGISYHMQERVGDEWKWVMGRYGIVMHPTYADAELTAALLEQLSEAHDWLDTWSDQIFGSYNG